jgi:hypothetical protein
MQLLAHDTYQYRDMTQEQLGTAFDAERDLRLALVAKVRELASLKHPPRRPRIRPILSAILRFLAAIWRCIRHPVVSVKRAAGWMWRLVSGKKPQEQKERGNT